MLVLARRLGETIIVNETTRITVIGIRNGQVRLGILAPRHVCVDREEVAQRKISEAPPARAPT